MVLRCVILPPCWGLLYSRVSPAAFPAAGQRVDAEEALSPGLRDYFRVISSLTPFCSPDIPQRHGSGGMWMWIVSGVPLALLPVVSGGSPVEFGLARAFCVSRCSLRWNLFTSLPCQRPELDVLSCHGL